jgi:enamine deaminase RidA (YjgF/YER057c/UK114 family)
VSDARVGERRFATLALDVMASPQPLATYVPGIEIDGFVFMSGHGPLGGNGAPVVVGRIGADVDATQGTYAVRLAMTNLIVSLRQVVGSLDRVRAVAQVRGYLRCEPGFADLDAVMVGASDILRDVFGPIVGGNVPSATGISECVLGLSATVDAIFVIDDN